MVLLQLHPQPVRELAAHHRLTHPGHGLKGLAGTHQIQREKSTCQPWCHIGAQGERIVVTDLTLNHNGTNRKHRMAGQPGAQCSQQQDCGQYKQQLCADPHEPDIQRQGQHWLHATDPLPAPAAGW